jgi:Ca2+:H+ antiporter
MKSFEINPVIERLSSDFFRQLDPRRNKLNFALIFIPITVFFEYNHSYGQAFLASMLAIMPLAYLMGKATEEISLRTGPSLGGLLNATFGNAVEIIIAALAIYSAYKNPDTAKIMIQVVQASLIGSILGNLLLVMGLAFVWGGVHYTTQKFSARASQINGSLLLLALAGMAIPEFYSSSTEGTNILSLSHYTAILLLLVYVLQLLFQFRTHTEIYAASSHHDEIIEMSYRNAVILLVTSTIFVSWMAEILVGSISHAAEEYHLPTLFIGVILVPLFGNAAEHFTAISVAGKNKMDLSVGIAIGSSIQIALFVAPLMVLIGWALNVPMTLQFGSFETLVTFMTVLVVNFIIQDGESNWLEGAMLLITYSIIALAFLLM